MPDESKKKRQKRPNVQKRQRATMLTASSQRGISSERETPYSGNKRNTKLFSMKYLQKNALSLLLLKCLKRLSRAMFRPQRLSLNTAWESQYSRLKTRPNMTKYLVPAILALRLSMVSVHADFTVLQHQADFASCTDKFYAIVGGFGSGKSQAVVYSALDKLRLRDWAVIPVYAPTYRDLADINIPDFQEMFDKYNIKYDWSASQRKMTVKQGVFTGEIWFRSMTNPEHIIGYDATDSLSDEIDVPKYDKQKVFFRKMIARMRGCNDATCGFATTPEGFKLTYDLFEKQKIGKLIRAKTTDNPFLPEDYIQSLMDMYDEQLIKQYINAEFVNINGLQAYYGFSRERNSLSNYDFEKQTGVRLDKTPTVSVGMDFNVKKMCAEIFHHDAKSERIHFYDEVVLKHMGYSDRTQTQVMCDILKEKFEGKRINVYPDASGGHRETSAIKSDIATLEQSGLYVYANKSNPSVRDRLNAANKKYGDGSITIDTDKCVELTEDNEKCQRDKYGEIDKSDEDRTHASDAGSYPIVYLYPVKHRIKTLTGQVTF